MPASALNTLGRVKPKTLARAREVLSGVEAAGHRINTIWGMGSSSEHATGNALDFMCTRAAGDWIADYLWKNRDRMGVKWIIWRQRIISTARSREGWRWMADRGNSTQNHYDHVHVLFSDTYSPPAQPIPPIIQPGVSGNDALWAGQRLVAHGFDRHYRVGPSREWGPADEANLREFQMIVMGKYNDTGKLDTETRNALKRNLFISSVRHAVQYKTPIDVRLLKFATLKLGVAPVAAQRSPGWWNSDLDGELGNWYIEAQVAFQLSIGDEPDPPLGPKQYALLGRKTGLFKGIE